LLLSLKRFAFASFPAHKARLDEASIKRIRNCHGVPVDFGG
jgi:hypothetical protein